MRSTRIFNGLVPLLVLLLEPARASLITWGAPYNLNHTDETLVSNAWDPVRNGGVAAAGAATLLTAVNYGYAGVTVNGIAFTQAPGATDFWGDTGIDPDIDALLSGHSAPDSSLFTLTLSGLTPGNLYQVQLIVGHDSRGTINQRQYEVSFGDGDFTSLGAAPVLTRAGYGNVAPPNPPTFDGFVSFGTVMGTFTAGAPTQGIQLRRNTLDGNTGDDVDPAVSAYVVFESAVPEPSTGLLALLGVLALVRRRRT